MTGCTKALWGGLSSGDCGPSTTNETENSKYVKSSTKIMSDTTSTANLDGTNIQTIELDFDGIKCIGGVDMSQTIVSEAQVYQEVSDTQIADLKTQLAADMDAQIDAVMDSQTEMMSDESNQKLVNTLKQSVTERIDKTISKDMVSNIIAKVWNSQDGTISFRNSELEGPRNADGTIGPCVKIDQNIMSKLVATQIVTSLQDAITSDSSITKMTTEIKSKMKSEAKGLNSLVDSLMSPLKIFAIIAGLGVFAIIILIVVRKMKSKSSSGSNKFIPLASLNKNKYV